eukprot:scpid64288/ scgid0828/ Peroxisomal NADH pyrophosphatase NUDT12; Nucleoside diphosphate-linked moiety X motif 12
MIQSFLHFKNTNDPGLETVQTLRLRSRNSCNAVLCIELMIPRISVSCRLSSSAIFFQQQQQRASDGNMSTPHSPARHQSHIARTLCSHSDEKPVAMANTTSATPARAVQYSATDGGEGQVLRMLLSSSASGSMDELRRNLKFVGGQFVNTPDERGWTALMYAARNGHSDVIQLLLEKGADMTARNPKGMSAYDIAVFWHQVKAVRVMHAHTTANNTRAPLPAGEAREKRALMRLDRCGAMREVLPFIRSAVQDARSRFILLHNLDVMVSFDRRDHPHVMLATAEEVAAYLPEKVWQEDSPIEPIDKERLVLFLGRMAGFVPSMQRLLSDVFAQDEKDEEGFALFAINLDDIAADAMKELLGKSLAGKTGGTGEVVYMPSMPGIMSLRGPQLTVASYARSLLAWHDRHRFCPTCGERTRVVHGGHKRLCSDPSCRSRHGVHNTCHPRVDPVVIVLVESPDGNSCLLARSARFPGRMFSCVSGFVECGETLEDAVGREVMEETGIALQECRAINSTCTGPYADSAPDLRPSSTMIASPEHHGKQLDSSSPPHAAASSVSAILEPVEYRGSQHWPFPASLMIAFFAKARSNEIDLNDGELAEARWFSQQEISAVFRDKNWRLGPRAKARGKPEAGSFTIPPPLAGSHQLIKFWLERKMAQQRSLGLSRL